MSKPMPFKPTLALAAFAAATAILPLATPAAAQPIPAGTVPPPPPNAILDRNNTGGDTNVVVPRGATGAETFTSSSSAGGNASQPELAVPNGSTGGGSAGSR